MWNEYNLCSDAGPSAANDNRGGFFWCAETGAGGGGSSQYWGMPSYQRGPGVINANTTFGNGTTHCSLAKTGTPCREAPDISANADEFTPYAEYCWFGIGETSLSSPLFFHDVTSAGHLATNNGLFPAVPGYDMATGIGTPKMSQLITRS